MNLLRTFITLGIFLLIGIGCSGSSNFGDEAPEVVTEKQGDEEKIFIIDRDGKKWDVTHAVKKYGFVASKFQFGLGKDAIPPIRDPQFHLPGEPGYPGASQTFLVIGTRLNDDARAYPLFVLKSHEIVVEQFGDIHVSVAY